MHMHAYITAFSLTYDTHAYLRENTNKHTCAEYHLTVSFSSLII